MLSNIGPPLLLAVNLLYRNYHFVSNRWRFTILINNNLTLPFCLGPSIFSSALSATVYPNPNPSGWHCRLTTIDSNTILRPSPWPVIILIGFSTLCYRYVLNLIDRFPFDGFCKEFSRLNSFLSNFDDHMEINNQRCSPYTLSFESATGQPPHAQFLWRRYDNILSAKTSHPRKKSRHSFHRVYWWSSCRVPVCSWGNPVFPLSTILTNYHGSENTWPPMELCPLNWS